MVLYALAALSEAKGDPNQAREYRERAAHAPPDYCFPARVEEMLLLQHSVAANPEDARAHYYLGNLYYDKKRCPEAITAWEASVQYDASFSIPWRNLGIAYFNIKRDARAALRAYENAFAANLADARLLYELDQLRKRTGDSTGQRFARLDQHGELVQKRDDLMIEFVALCNLTGQSQRALDILLSRRFNPWEGGEGLVSGQYVWTHFLLGRSAFDRGNAEAALCHFEAARQYPENLGEGKSLFARETHLDYYTGLALASLGRNEEAKTAWQKAAHSPAQNTMFEYYRALAYRRLGDEAAATARLRSLHDFASKQMKAEVRIDYFATSLPDFLLFEDDLQKRNRAECLFLRALARTGLGNQTEAAADLQELHAIDGNHFLARVEFGNALDGAQMSGSSAQMLESNT
jgi:tetratricopeptide (TPR) repeat protein